MWRVTSRSRRSVLFHRIIFGWWIFVQFTTNIGIRWDVVLIELRVFSIYADVSKVVDSIDFST